MDDRVALTIGGNDRYARVARTVVASCASVAGFSTDDLIDVRLLADMAFDALLELGSGDISITIDTRAGVVELEMSAARAGTRGWDDPDVELLATVAAVIASDYELGGGADRLVVHATMEARDIRS